MLDTGGSHTFLSLLSRAEAGMAPSSASQLAPRPVPSAPPRQGLLIAKKRSGGALLGPGRRFAEGGTVSHGAEVPIDGRNCNRPEGGHDGPCEKDGEGNGVCQMKWIRRCGAPSDEQRNGVGVLSKGMEWSVVGWRW